MTLERIVNQLKKDLIDEPEEDYFHRVVEKEEESVRYVNKLVYDENGEMQFKRVRVDE